jgi:hypothetical protein
VLLRPAPSRSRDEGAQFAPFQFRAEGFAHKENPMKKWQSASMIAALTLVAVFAPCPPFTLLAQPHLTDAQILALRPAPPSLVPSCGNFWSVSRPDYPPYPYDPYPDLPVYQLPDGSWLVDDSTIQFPPSGQTIGAPAAARSLLTPSAAWPPSSAWPRPC